MTIETLFLDAGGVLVFPNWERVAGTLATHGVHVDAAVLAAAEAPAKREMDVPVTDVLTSDRERGWRYFDLVLERAGIPPSEQTRAALADLERYHEEWNVWEHVPAGVVPALGRFRALGLRLVVVSNANGRLRQLLNRLGLATYLDVIIDSGLEGVEKPDPRLFRIALERSGATAATTLHVGDLYHVDVAGARAAGLHAALLDAANLYGDADCPRMPSLDALADRLAQGWS